MKFFYVYNERGSFEKVGADKVEVNSNGDLTFLKSKYVEPSDPRLQGGNTPNILVYFPTQGFASGVWKSFREVTDEV